MIEPAESYRIKCNTVYACNIVHVFHIHSSMVSHDGKYKIINGFAFLISPGKDVVYATGNINTLLFKAFSIPHQCLSAP